MTADPVQPIPLTDEAAIARVLAGDPSAFEAIVRRWQTPLVNLAWRFCRDRTRAEEMAQEAFLRAWRNLAQFRGESAFSTWLFSLAANLYRTELRRMPATPLSLDDIAEPPDPRLASLALEETSRDEAVRRAVLALPPKYRDAILLFYFHEQDVPATARTLKVPEGTVKARLFRARKLLRSKFARPSSRNRTASNAASLAAHQHKEAQ
ncbi:MAG TPA: sigma-70 family RNA polymerase sigma factor [Acidobacteriaceae bacterium]|jgi:RNA polymerase sigma-70 factor (ECF subfamily)|nr:sigma-70 family RNA polymerase sigma factor [Acidobacteriaceae bacterium]